MVYRFWFLPLTRLCVLGSLHTALRFTPAISRGPHCCLATARILPAHCTLVLYTPPFGFLVAALSIVLPLDTYTWFSCCHFRLHCSPHRYHCVSVRSHNRTPLFSLTFFSFAPLFHFTFTAALVAAVLRLMLVLVLVCVSRTVSVPGSRLHLRRNRRFVSRHCCRRICRRRLCHLVHGSAYRSTSAFLRLGFSRRTRCTASLVAIPGSHGSHCVLSPRATLPYLLLRVLRTAPARLRTRSAAPGSAFCRRR